MSNFLNDCITYLSIGVSNNLLYLFLIALFSVIIAIILTKLCMEQNLLETIIYLSLLSINICIIYLLLDAPDVAMTEAALGAGITTFILLQVLKKLDSLALREPSIPKPILNQTDEFKSEATERILIREYARDLKNSSVSFEMGNGIKGKNFFAATVTCIFLVVILVYINKDFYILGASDSPVHNFSAKYYIENTGKDIGVNSIVAAILASYRGFDTLGETFVIFIGGIIIFIIFKIRGKNNVQS